MNTPSLTRRGILAVAASTGAAALLAQPAGLVDTARASANSNCDPHASITPYGVNQAGITTNAPSTSNWQASTSSPAPPASS